MSLCECGCGSQAPLATRTRAEVGWVKGEPIRFIHGHNQTCPSWSCEAALEAVRAFARRRGYQPVSREAGRYHRIPDTNTAIRLFGSWNEMIRAAGFEPYPAQSSFKAKQLARRDRAAA